MRSPGKRTHYYRGYYIYPCRRPESLAKGERWFVCKDEVARLLHGETYSLRAPTLDAAKALIRGEFTRYCEHHSFEPCPACLKNPNSAQRLNWAIFCAKRDARLDNEAPSVRGSAGVH